MAPITWMANSWKALYGNLIAKAGNQGEDLLKVYLDFLPHGGTAFAVRDNLCSEQDYAVLVSSAGSAQILHHFKYDRLGGFNTDATGSLWALTGTEETAVCVSLTSKPEEKPFSDIKYRVPAFAQLSKATTPSMVKDIPYGEGTLGTAAPSIRCLSGIVLPPFMASALMQTDSEDPAVFCIIACKAIVDYDAWVAQAEIESTGAAATGPGPAAATLWPIPAFLWAMATQEDFPSTTTRILAKGRPQAWCQEMHARNITGIPPAPTGPAGGNLPVNANVGSALAALAAGLQAQAAATTSAQEQKTESAKSKKGFNKMAPEAQRMILRASERIADGELDENGNDISGMMRTTPVNHYRQVLEATSTASAKQLAVMIIRRHLKCSSFRTADATVVALRDGTLEWPRDDCPGAFSIFACGPTPVSNVATGPASDSNLALALAATEGHGLSAGQIAQMTKIVLQVPDPSVDSMATFLKNYDGLLQFTFGGDACTRLAIVKWLAHITHNRNDYELAIEDDPLFTLKLLVSIERVMQRVWTAALCEESEATFKAEETRLLRQLDDDRSDVERRRFHVSGMPAHLMSLAQAKQDRFGGAFSTPPRPKAFEPRTSPQSSGRKRDRQGGGGSQVSGKKKLAWEAKDANPSIDPRLRSIHAAGAHGQACLHAMYSCPRTANGYDEVCYKWHFRGECGKACPREKSHSMPKSDIDRVAKWAATIQPST